MSAPRIFRFRASEILRGDKLLTPAHSTDETPNGYKDTVLEGLLDDSGNMTFKVYDQSFTEGIKEYS